MSSEQKQMLEFAIQDLIAQIVDKESLSPEGAMDALYHSPFLLKLNDPATGYYREGAEYLYSKYRSV